MSDLDYLLMSPKLAAQKLNVSSKTIHNWRKEGRIKCVPLPNGRFKVPYNEVCRIQQNGTGPEIFPGS